MTLDEVELSTPVNGQVLVRVLGAAANFPDALLCRGTYQMRPELPFTPGVELCGEVIEMGPDAHGLQIGDRVIGSAILPHGGFAEYALMDSDSTFLAPPSLSDAQAAGFYIGYQTGWFGLHRRARIRAGETLLIHAAAGGVGSAAIQLGKAAGAHVIAVAGGPEKAEVARRLGADITIDRHTEDFVEVVKQETGGRGVDVIYDPVGGDTYTRSVKAIAFEGRVVVVGFAGGTIQSATLNHPLVKNYSILGLHWGLYAKHDPLAVRQCHDELTKLASAGLLDPLVSEELSLGEVAAGVQRLADGATVGRVVYVADSSRSDEKALV
jgi:NADPH2:quinone reductase